MTQLEERLALDLPDALTVDKVHETEEDVGNGLEGVVLTYWHGAEQFEAAHPGEGESWQMANANSRLVAEHLESEGYEVHYSYGE